MLIWNMSRVLQSFWPIVSPKTDLWHNRDFSTETLGFLFVIWYQESFNFKASFEFLLLIYLCHGLSVVVRFRIWPRQWMKMQERSRSTDLKEKKKLLLTPPVVKPLQGDACAKTRRTNSQMESCELSHFVGEPIERESERGDRGRMRETDEWKSCEAWGTFCWLEQEEVTESLMWPVRLEAAWGRWHIQGNVLAHPPAVAVFIPGSLFGAAGAGEVERGRLARNVCTLWGTLCVPPSAWYLTDGSAWLMPCKSARGCGDLISFAQMWKYGRSLGWSFAQWIGR